MIQIATTAAALTVLIAIGPAVVPHLTTIIDPRRITQPPLLQKKGGNNPVGISPKTSHNPAVEELAVG
jgi:hypothetical protein